MGQFSSGITNAFAPSNSENLLDLLDSEIKTENLKVNGPEFKGNMNKRNNRWAENELI